MELLEKMNVFNDEMLDAGVLLACEGLHASNLGARISYDASGTPAITDGPFAETKELVAGFWIISVKSKDDAIAWMRRAPFTSSDIEIRQVFEPEDFAGVASPEMIAEEREFRKRVEQNR